MQQIKLETWLSGIEETDERIMQHHALSMRASVK